MDYKNMNIDDIIKWCQDNNQVEWLKAKAAEMKSFKVYPTKQIEVNGKTKTVADKTQKPTVEKRQISFIQLKHDFAMKFMPEIMPKAKTKAPSMYERIANL